VREEVSPRSYERYSEIVWGFLAPELGALPVGKLAPSHIQAAYTKWSTEGRRDGKPARINRTETQPTLWSCPLV
jgi:hypothetical protein